ncbi:MAG: hypothetical protein ACOYN6_06685 [Ignavibacteria bacterium]
MEENTILNIFIFVGLLCLTGFSLLFYLKSVILNLNQRLIDNFQKNNQIIINNFDKIVLELINKLNDNHVSNVSEIKKFTDYLKKETDRYSETTAKYRNNITSLNDKITELVEVNKGFINELRDVSFKDIKNVTEAIQSTRDSFSKIESSFSKNSKNIIDLLNGLKSMQDLFSESEKNFSVIVKLNNNVDDLITKFKEALVQIQLVSNSISVLSEGKLKPMISEISNVLPQIRQDASKLSSDLYGKFSDSLDVLESVSKELNNVARKYNTVLDGSRKDPLTGEFIK